MGLARKAFLLLFGLILLGGTAAYFIWIFPPPAICPADIEPRSTGTWEKRVSMPTARSELAAADLDGKIYVAGGLRLTGATVVFEYYVPVMNAWQEAAPLPEKLHHFSLTAIGQNLYLAGGYERNNFSMPTDALWIYDPLTDSWAAGADMPSGRAAHAAAAVDDKLYVVGGVGLESNFLWTYDPDSDSWATVPTTLPTPREHLAAAALDGRLYAIGGRTAELGNLSVVEVHDPEITSWTRVSDMPTARGGITAGTIQGKIHVAGGEDFYVSPNCTLGQHEAFDPINDSWSTLPPLPTPRHGLASAVVDDQWYIIGGAEKPSALTLVSTSDQVEVYQP